MLWRALNEARVSIGNFYLPEKELLDLQLRKLRRVLRYSYDHVPLYHERFRRSGILPEDVHGAGDMARLPVLTRGDIEQNYPSRIVVHGAPVGMSLRTSGTSTGHPLNILRGARDCDAMLALQIRKAWVAGIRPWWKNLFMEFRGARNIESSMYLLSRVQEILFGYTTLHVATIRQSLLYVRPDNLRETALAMYNARPDVIQMNPSFMRRLGYTLKEEGLAMDLKALFVSNEPMTARCREELQDLFHSEVLNSYGSTELGVMGHECPEHMGTHLNADYFLFEFVRSEDLGSGGDVVDLIVTSLENEAMPLIRYKVGDTVRLAEAGKCRCGSYLPRVRQVEGRRISRIVSESGESYSPSFIMDYLEGVIGIRDYQVIQTKGGAVKVKVIHQDNTRETGEALTSYFRGILGPTQLVETEGWAEDDVPRRYLHVVSEVPSRPSPASS